jgi:hypothetical protein
MRFQETRYNIYILQGSAPQEVRVTKIQLLFTEEKPRECMPVSRSRSSGLVGAGLKSFAVLIIINWWNGTISDCEKILTHCGLKTDRKEYSLRKERERDEMTASISAPRIFRINRAKQGHSTDRLCAFNSLFVQMSRPQDDRNQEATVYLVRSDSVFTPPYRYDPPHPGLGQPR